VRWRWLTRAGMPYRRGARPNWTSRWSHAHADGVIYSRGLGAGIDIPSPHVPWTPSPHPFKRRAVLSSTCRARTAARVPLRPTQPGAIRAINPPPIAPDSCFTQNGRGPASITHQAIEGEAQSARGVPERFGTRAAVAPGERRSTSPAACRGAGDAIPRSPAPPLGEREGVRGNPCQATHSRQRYQCPARSPACSGARS